MSAGDQWLFGRLRSMGEWRDHGLPGAVEESHEGALAGVDALRAAGVLGADDASAWRERLAAEAGGRRAAVPPSPEVRAGASGLLEELLAEVPAEDPWEDSGYERFGGALELLAAIGAADAAGGWDARLRARTGQASREEEEALTRELNAGGTEVELEGDPAARFEVAL